VAETIAKHFETRFNGDYGGGWLK